MKYKWWGLKVSILLGVLFFNAAPVAKTIQGFADPTDRFQLVRRIVPAVSGEHLDLVKDFVRRHRYNCEVSFLIDMSLPSGSPRFLVYDLKKDSVVTAGLVTHGNCYQYWLEGRRYSNQVGSGCTSLGKYKIGKSYYGKFGLAYKLSGLDDTNNNAFKRCVVLHAHACVPDTETNREICQSNGCPTVSPGFLLQLQAIIDTSSRPVLLYIYE